MLNKLFFIVLLAGFSHLHAQKSVKTEPLKVGEVKTIHSEELGEERVLNVYLPQSFKASETYPVIYVLDGSMNEDFIHIFGLVQFYQLQFGMPECIIVGIANVDRKRDFTHHTDKADMLKDLPTGGHSAKFISFIEKELQPFIQKTYKTSGKKYLIGQSLGGLLASEILLKKAHLFSHYFIVSPSLWWDDQSMLKQSGKLLGQQTHEKLFVYISVGKGEHPIMRRDAKELNKSIQKLGKERIELHFNLMKNEDHASILHNSIYDGLEILFKK